MFMEAELHFGVNVKSPQIIYQIAPNGPLNINKTIKTLVGLTNLQFTPYFHQKYKLLVALFSLHPATNCLTVCLSNCSLW